MMMTTMLAVTTMNTAMLMIGTRTMLRLNMLSENVASKHLNEGSLIDKLEEVVVPRGR